MNKGGFLSIFAGLRLFLWLTVFSSALLAQNYQVIIYPPDIVNYNDTSGFGLGGIQRAGAGRIAGFVSPENTHALLWLGDSPVPLDLHPSDPYWNYSKLNDTDGQRQVGYVEHTDHPNSTLGGPRYAAIWSGTAQSFVQLCGFTGTNCYYSEAVAIGGDQQVGHLVISGIPPNGLTGNDNLAPASSQFKAALWRGAPGTYVDLHPRNVSGMIWSNSKAFDTDGIQQVGYGLDEARGIEFRHRALLWNGTRDNFVDLNPPDRNYNYVEAYGVKNGVQVGSGYVYSPDSGCSDALVWRGTAASYRILANCAVAIDTNGTTHIGAAQVGYYNHAFRWDDATGAGFDLHTLLPPGVYRSSNANDIDENGNIIGTAQRASDYRTVAVVWRNLLPNVAPTVSLIDPAISRSYSMNSPMMLSADASDDDGTIVSVEFIINGETVSASAAKGGSGFQSQWTPTRAGTYRIQARATDNNGAVSVSRPVIVRMFY